LNVRFRPIADIQATAELRLDRRIAAAIIEFRYHYIRPTFHAFVPFLIKLSAVNLTDLPQGLCSTLVRCLQNYVVDIGIAGRFDYAIGYRSDAVFLFDFAPDFHIFQLLT